MYNSYVTAVTNQLYCFEVGRHQINVIFMSKRLCASVKVKHTFTNELLMTMAMELHDLGQHFLDVKYLRRAMYLPYQMKQAHRRRQYEQRLRQSLYNLQKQGCVTKKEDGGKLIVTLTDKGRTRILHAQLKEAPQHPTGTCTLVFFDIPERIRTTRMLFRRFLKSGGFYLWQQSVWACDRDTLSIIDSFAKAHKISHWVTVCTTSQLSGSPSIK